MEFSYTKRQRLVIELTNNQVFEGDCEKCAKDRIDIINVIEYPKGEKLKGSLSYYRCEIASVRVLNQENGKQTEQLQLNKEAQVTSSRKRISLSRNEYDRLKDMTTKYIYLATMDSRYLKATEYLNNCEYIGVFGIGSEVGRIKPISLLLLSSWEQVYIFDLLLCGKKNFPPDLKTILESNQVKKVVHNSRSLFNGLWHCYKVKLNNIFDTYVADMNLEKAQTGCEPEKTRNLLECLGHYLNFPSTLLEQATEVSLKEWEERPLDESYRIKAAQLVAYLITLKNNQEKLLLKGYYDAVATYSQMVVNADGYTARKILNSGNVVPEEIKNFYDRMS